MNIKQVIDKITDKWAAKLVCLVLAVFLYILHQTTLIQKKTIVVPLNVIEEGNCTYVGHLEKNVSIVVRATQEDISSIQPSEITASINLNSYTKTGVCEVPVNITLSERLLALDPLEIKVKPEKVSVDIQERVIKFVEVKPSIVDKVAYGYKIENITCNPPYVEIFGPKSIVDEIDEIKTKRITVSNASQSFTAETSYYDFNKMIDVPFKGPYKVTVAIVPETIEKIVNDITIVPENLPEGLEVKNIISPVSVKLEGNLLYLEKYVIPEKAFTVNLSNISEPGIYDLPVIGKVNNNVVIKGIIPETVPVTVTRKETDFEVIPAVEEIKKEEIITE